MPWYFFLFLGVAGLVAWVCYKWHHNEQEYLMELITPKQKELLTIGLFGGPADTKTEKVEKLDPFYIVPYTPDPETEDVEVVGNIGGQDIHLPRFAFYQQMGTEPDYIYRRDMTAEEIMDYTQTKKLPSDLSGNA